jgi:hypothetical protein
MTDRFAVVPKTTEWMASYIKDTKYAPGNRRLAKQYREEFFVEYSTGVMDPEKKAIIISILGPGFFRPVDRFASECHQQQYVVEPATATTAG